MAYYGGNVTPDTWLDAGGTASLNLYRSNYAIVVNHTGDGHKQLRQYLDSLRAEGKTTESLNEAKK